MASEARQKLTGELIERFQQRSKSTPVLPQQLPLDVRLSGERTSRKKAPPPPRPLKPRGLSERIIHSSSSNTLEGVTEHKVLPRFLGPEERPPLPMRKSKNLATRKFENLTSRESENLTAPKFKNPRTPNSESLETAFNDAKDDLLIIFDEDKEPSPLSPNLEGRPLLPLRKSEDFITSTDKADEELLIIFNEESGTIETEVDIYKAQESSPLEVATRAIRQTPKRIVEIIQPQKAVDNVSRVFSPAIKGATKAAGTVNDHVAQPAVKFIGNGFQETGTRLKTFFGNIDAQIEVPELFAKTRDDFVDLADRMKGVDSLCSKCRTLPTKAQLLSGNVDWATPLARVVYHAEWCRVCRMLLDLFCEADADPFQHPAIGPFLQPELKNQSMRYWADRGWKYTNEHWPFGHGTKYHPGATWVLGTVGDLAWGIVVRGGGRLLFHTFAKSRNPQVRASNSLRTYNRLEKPFQSRDPNKHPLNCVIRIVSDSKSSSMRPGLLEVSLWGYGRAPDAKLQKLSGFRLRGVSGKESDAISTSVSLQKFNTFQALSYAKLLHPHWIDPSVGKLWLAHCLAKHGSKCSELGWTLPSPQSFRVIDVRDMCLRTMGKLDHCQYLTLSYVWGGSRIWKLEKSNKEALVKKGGLLKFMGLVAQTIVDAMGVVSSMGERYLWVDALCIVQDDPVDNAEQIASMDRIYGNSLATIIAAQSKTADDGIEGIRPELVPHGRQHAGRQRYLYQTAARLDDDTHLIAPLKTTDHNIESSVWNKRAWTFQERLLSRRLIIFTHGQILWQCRQMNCREDMSAEDSGVPYSALQHLSFEPRHFGKHINEHWRDGSIEVTRHNDTLLVRSAVFVEYARAVAQFTHRSISFQNDVLNAFDGLGKVFQSGFNSATVFGLPESLLDVALLWRPMQQLERRAHFPSWCWAGWNGSIAYDSPFRISRYRNDAFKSFELDEYGQEGIRPLIRWHVYDSTSRFVILVNGGTGVGIPWEAGRSLPAEWENGPWTIDSRGLGKPSPAPKIPRRLTGIAALIPSELMERALIFWSATSTAFHAGTLILSQQSDLRDSNRSTRPPQRLQILDLYASTVGNMLLDENQGAAGTSAHAVSEPWELVQVAESQYLGLDNEARDVDGFPYYVVMLVAKGKAEGVRERRGLGRIAKAAWEMGRPRLELVVLV